MDHEQDYHDFAHMKDLVETESGKMAPKIRKRSEAAVYKDVPGQTFQLEQNQIVSKRCESPDAGYYEQVSEKSLIRAQLK